MNEFADVLSPVLSSIINAVNCTFSWPAIWKRVEDTIIPKRDSPETFDDCRNISCTSIFSKLCEAYMLDSLHSEIQLPVQQYGGVKGCGTEHYLVDMNTEILEAIDGNRAAISLLSHFSADS